MRLWDPRKHRNIHLWLMQAVSHLKLQKATQ